MPQMSATPTMKTAAKTIALSSIAGPLSDAATYYSFLGSLTPYVNCPVFPGQSRCATIASNKCTTDR